MRGTRAPRSASFSDLGLDDLRPSEPTEHAPNDHGIGVDASSDFVRGDKFSAVKC